MELSYRIWDICIKLTKQYPEGYDSYINDFGFFAVDLDEIFKKSCIVDSSILVCDEKRQLNDSTQELQATTQGLQATTQELQASTQELQRCKMVRNGVDSIIFENGAKESDNVNPVNGDYSCTNHEEIEHFGEVETSKVVTESEEHMNPVISKNRVEKLIKEEPQKSECYSDELGIEVGDDAAEHAVNTHAINTHAVAYVSKNGINIAENIIINSQGPSGNAVNQEESSIFGSNSFVDLNDAKLNDDYLRTLMALSRKLKFVEAHSSIKTSKSLKDVQPELGRLRQKVFEFIVQKLYALRKPKTNIQILQQSVLLKYKYSLVFLKTHGKEKYVVRENFRVEVCLGNEIVWSTDGEYAVRESTSRVKIFNKNFQERRSIRPTFSAERIFGGICSNDFICFHDWAECRLIRCIDVNVKNLYWADSGDLLTIASDTSFYILKYNEDIIFIFDPGGGSLVSAIKLKCYYTSLNLEDKVVFKGKGL